jgi:hypothetical protein
MSAQGQSRRLRNVRTWLLHLDHRTSNPVPICRITNAVIRCAPVAGHPRGRKFRAQSTLVPANALRLICPGPAIPEMICVRRNCRCLTHEARIRLLQNRLSTVCSSRTWPAAPRVELPSKILRASVRHTDAFFGCSPARHYRSSVDCAESGD